jgi:hypothetical protein
MGFDIWNLLRQLQKFGGEDFPRCLKLNGKSKLNSPLLRSEGKGGDLESLLILKGDGGTLIFEKELGRKNYYDFGKAKLLLLIGL